MAMIHAGDKFKERVVNGGILPLIGVYDIFSAIVAAKYFDGVFCSGLSYAASSYGKPDVGFVNWRDMIDFSTRLRAIMPDKHILVDIDDGFGDENVCSSTVNELDLHGLSAVMLEDQRRPRRCGHYDGKVLLPIDEYIIKLKTTLDNRKSLFVIARTDETDHFKGISRAVRFEEAGADAVMVEAVSNLEEIKEISRNVSVPIMVNQIHGGKSPNWSLPELEDAGVSIVIYSSPCLFAAQFGIENYLSLLKEEKKLPSDNTVSMMEFNDVIYSRFKV
jgi:2-methylisocitrate lyase-like PEP mutase family enzyme